MPGLLSERDEGRKNIEIMTMKHHCKCCKKKAKQVAWLKKRIKIFQKVTMVNEKDTETSLSLRIILNVIKKAFANGVEKKK